ncbi:MAG: preprotein translocase subunit SecA [Verrucomicrobia bacterium]|nr:preprotein translocase subunit SecA [Verrucomicrobiota bacterium]
MFSWVLKKIVGTKNQRELRRLKPLVGRINEIEREYQALSDDQLRAKTGEFKRRFHEAYDPVHAEFERELSAAGDEPERKAEVRSRWKQRLRAAEQAALDALLPEAFAAVKNVCRRLAERKHAYVVTGHEAVWDMVPYDVQLIGGIAIHRGMIAEMATGEGKTLVATMPMYLNALTGKNCHLVSTNDFLVRRDSEWMGPVYEFLGVTVGCLQTRMPHADKVAAYRADITYGMNSEFGFDYLRDNGMATRPEEQVQRGHFFAVIDEVDSILIDEARTPLIITAPVSRSTHQYDRYKPAVDALARRQTILCNRLVKEAREAWDAGDEETAAVKLYQVSKGAPKHKQLLKMIEEGEVRRALDRISTQLLSEARKEQHEEIKEQLFYLIDERGHAVELTDMGRTELSPDDPEQFVLPGIIQRPLIDELVRMQVTLCSRRAGEAEAAWARGEREEALDALVQVTRGAPQHARLRALRDDKELRRALEARLKHLLERDGRAERERLDAALYYVVERDGEGARLTAKGRTTLWPKDNEKPPTIRPDDADGLEAAVPGETLVETATGIERRLDEEHTRKAEALHNISQLLRAYALYEKDVEYVVQDNRVMIVDEFTGRLLPGRRYSEGLHQAIEAKEGVTIERETQTFATVTIQNYFRMYEKLAGMTGTAETEAGEFKQIYKLDVLVIPTNQPVRRLDANDAIYKTRREKYNAIVEEVVYWHGRGRPILIGTVSVEVSELLSRYLRRRGVPHNVLNAKNHAGEAEIVARAGQPGAVTIATNMAGRGTDIKLGPGIVPDELRQYTREHPGPDDWRAFGFERDGETLRYGDFGLLVIGTERHEARRIDRQLRGRCARQGDPGASKFYVSLEDDLMRQFRSERIATIMTRLGLKEGEEMSHPWLNKSIETAQKRVEINHFSIRKRTLEYDDVMNRQREVIYEYRNRVLSEPDLRPMFALLVEEVVEDKLDEFCPEGALPETWSLGGLEQWLSRTARARPTLSFLLTDAAPRDAVRRAVIDKVQEGFRLKERLEGEERIGELLRFVMLSSIDNLWKDHLYTMDDLRDSVGQRAYAQLDPLIEYKKEGFDAFNELMAHVRTEIVTGVFRTTAVPPDVARALAVSPEQLAYSDVEEALRSHFVGAPGAARSGPSIAPPPEGMELGEVGAKSAGGDAPAVQTIRRAQPKVGRNDPCPCGSGKKYKKCCGRLG